MNKHAVLDGAEVFDSWRVVPRFFLFFCLGWAVDITHILVFWYVHLPKEERTVEASGFGFLVFTAILGFLKLVYSDYKDAGRDWNERPIPNTSTVTATTVERTTATVTP